MFAALHPLLLQASPAASCNDPSFLVAMVLMVGVFYFIILRPQQKQQQTQKTMLASLKKGDSVVTQSGLFGRVVQVNDKDLLLEISVGGGSTKVRWLKSQVAGLEPAAKAADADKSDAKADDKPSKA